MEQTGLAMPQSDSPKKSKVAFYVSPITVEEAEGLAERSGQTLSEIYRQAVEIGISKLMEQETHKLVNRKVRMSIERLESGKDE